MNNLKGLTNGKCFLYQLDDGGAGIVEANNKEEAKLKVAWAYHKHGQPDVHSYDVEIYDIDSCNCQDDSPDVIELCWEIQTC